MLEVIRLIGGLIVSITVLVVLSRFLKLHAFFGLLIVSLLFGTITGVPLPKIIQVMQLGFGSLLGQIGFVVALGACLGVILEKTGAMHIIAHKILHTFGSRRALLAMSALGLMVGIPVFCDSGFIILSRLIPTIAIQSGVPGSSLALAFSTGLFTTHSLVPPTPGPLAAATNLGLSDDIGLVILIGSIGAVPIGLTGYFFARKIGPTFHIVSEPADPSPSVNISAWKAWLPLITPMVLISLATIPKIANLDGRLAASMSVMGQPFIALAIGVLLAIPLIRRADPWPAWISAALTDAGVILLITGAGGAFGSVIKESGLENILTGAFAANKASGLALVLMGFLIAAILKTAQGSTTSSMIITTSLMAPLLSATSFENPVQLSALVLAVGSGGMCISHANDSYFWVVSQFGGISPADTLKSFTRITFYQAVAGLVTAIVIYALW